LKDPELLHALTLTLLVAGIAVPLNVVFGLAAAWAITKGKVRGHAMLVALADLPLAVSPVIAGLTWDLNKKVALSLDYQEQTPHNGAIFTPTKIYFLHLVANF